MSINIQSDLPQIPLPWLASYMMGNYSEEQAIFNASPITIMQSLQISERRNKTRSETGGGGGEGGTATMRRRDERVFLQKEEEETSSVGFVQIQQRRGELQECFLSCFFPYRENPVKQSHTSMRSDRLLTPIWVIFMLFYWRRLSCLIKPTVTFLGK